MVELYELHYKELLIYGIQLCKDIDQSRDFINDVFLQLWENRARLGAIANMRAYLFACMRRRVFKALGKAGREIYPGDDALPAAADPSHEEMVMAMQQTDEIRRKVQHALGKLTTRQKELIMMRYYQQLDYSEIEAATGMTMKTIYNTIYNAMRVLSSELKGVPIPFLLFFFFEKS